MGRVEGGIPEPMGLYHEKWKWKEHGGEEEEEWEKEKGERGGRRKLRLW